MCGSIEEPRTSSMKYVVEWGQLTSPPTVKLRDEKLICEASWLSILVYTHLVQHAVIWNFAAHSTTSNML